MTMIQHWGLRTKPGAARRHSSQEDAQMDGRAAKKQRTEPRAPVAVPRHSDIAVHTRLH